MTRGLEIEKIMGDYILFVPSPIYRQKLPTILTFSTAYCWLIFIYLLPLSPYMHNFSSIYKDCICPQEHTCYVILKLHSKKFQPILKSQLPYQDIFSNTSLRCSSTRHHFRIGLLISICLPLSYPRCACVKF